MWFNRSVMNSWFRVNVPSCPNSIVASPDLPRAQSLSPLWCLQGVGGGDMCVCLLVWVKSLMRFTTGCFEDNQLQHLLGESNIWGLDLLLLLLNLFWSDKIWILYEATVSAFKHLFGGFTVYEFSPCQLLIWVYSKERNFCQAALQVRKPCRPSVVSSSPSTTLPIKEHAYATKGYLSGTCSFFLSSWSQKGH